MVYPLLSDPSYELERMMSHSSHSHKKRKDSLEFFIT